MSRSVKVRDEQNFEWIVYAEDPAWNAIRPLPKTMAYYALPRKILKTGKWHPYNKPFFYDVEIPKLTPELKELVVLQERIYQSVQYLKGKL